MSYIEKEKVLEQFNSLEQLARKRVFDTPTNSPAYERYSTQYCEREKALSIIKAQPTADVVEVRHGEWIKQKPDPEVMKEFHNMGLGKGMSVNSVYWICSICETWGTPTHKYCCSCGAKMDGKRREE